MATEAAAAVEVAPFMKNTRSSNIAIPCTLHSSHIQIAIYRHQDHRFSRVSLKQQELTGKKIRNEWRYCPQIVLLVPILFETYTQSPMLLERYYIQSCDPLQIIGEHKNTIVRNPATLVSFYFHPLAFGHILLVLILGLCGG